MSKPIQCVKCKKFAKFGETRPAPGVDGRIHQIGFGCRKKETQPVVKAEPTKPKAVIRTFQEMADYAKGIIRLSSGMEVKLPRHKAPLTPMLIGGKTDMKFIPKSYIVSTQQGVRK